MFNKYKGKTSHNIILKNRKCYCPSIFCIYLIKNKLQDLFFFSKWKGRKENLIWVPNKNHISLSLIQTYKIFKTVKQNIPMVGKDTPYWSGNRQNNYQDPCLWRNWILITDLGEKIITIQIPFGFSTQDDIVIYRSWSRFQNTIRIHTNNTLYSWICKL